MANTTYSSLIASVFNKIKDINLASIDENIATEIVSTYISPACTKFQSCNQNLEDRDEELQQFGFELEKNNYNILVDYMVLEWLDSNFIKTSSALKPRLSSSDFKSLNLPQSLGKAIELHNTLKKETDQLAINKSYKNSKLFDLVTNRKKVQQ